ncbi:orotidine-5'-phosphate decarboxylase [Marinoscillum sp. MHG1-6]|uniref:orotidine-5'-phosphate decarboxylase n=1 Tax=Marinoscillum sp. MHG1-6 TaxID=2959627 RepID=UPI0021588380|nr:orotidine-5'-phosphate decarboxylase [Marinoscillum sp. MHG1-6]
MTRQELFKNIVAKESFLCVGLDTDISRIPAHLLNEDDPIFEFNKQIIDATYQSTIAYKPNLAFYEALGPKGWESLAKTVEYIPKDIFTIADAKRADIGNTSSMYAKAFFEEFSFDSVTVNPYMGEDSVTPFLQYDGKWVILLAATSNHGSFDFQDLMIENHGEKLYERVIRKSIEWGDADNLMYVVGATRPESLVSVRTIVPDSFLLIPGVGAQGGSLESVCKYGMNKQCGLIVNSSRGIIYAGNDKNFAQDAGKAAKELQQNMSQQLQQFK